MEYYFYFVDHRSELAPHPSIVLALFYVVTDNSSPNPFLFNESFCVLHSLTYSAIERKLLDFRSSLTIFLNPYCFL